LVGAVLCVAAWPASTASAAAPVVVQTFAPTGEPVSNQIFVVPDVPSLQFTVQGGNGGPGYPGASAPGGGGIGAQLTGTISVTQFLPGDFQQLHPGDKLDFGVGSAGKAGTRPDPNGRCVVNIDVSQGGFPGTNNFAEVETLGGAGGPGDLCTGGGGGGGGAETLVTMGYAEGPLLVDVGGGGGGGGGGGDPGGLGGQGGSLASGSDGSGPGHGSGGGYVAAAVATGGAGGSAYNSSSGGGGGGGGGGWVRGGGGGGGASLAGGGGGGGAGTVYFDSHWLRNPSGGVKPAGSPADGVVIISYTPSSPGPLAKLQCAGQPATMVVKGPALVTGTSGRDVIVGDPGPNQINGAGGNDVICGGAGADVLEGAGGDDVLRGESGRDQVSGGAGNDDLADKMGHDRLAGGTGNDRIDTTNGSQNNVDCGPGRDRLKADRRDQFERCERSFRKN
jgi:hypothetical protein